MKTSVVKMSLVLAAVLVMAAGTANAVIIEIDTLDQSGLSAGNLSYPTGEATNGTVVVVPGGTTGTITDTVTLDEGVYAVAIRMQNDNPYDLVNVTINGQTFGATCADAGMTGTRYSSPLMTGGSAPYYDVVNIPSTGPYSIVIDPNTGGGSTVRLDSLILTPAQYDRIVEVDELNIKAFQWLSESRVDAGPDATTNGLFAWSDYVLSYGGIAQYSGAVELDAGRYSVGARANNSHAANIMRVTVPSATPSWQTLIPGAGGWGARDGNWVIDIPANGVYGVTVNIQPTSATRIDSLIFSKQQEPPYIELDELNWLDFAYLGNEAKIDVGGTGSGNGYVVYVLGAVGPGDITGVVNLQTVTYDVYISMNNDDATAVDVTIAGVGFSASESGTGYQEVYLGQLEVNTAGTSDVLVHVPNLGGGKAFRLDYIKLEEVLTVIAVCQDVELTLDDVTGEATLAPEAVDDGSNDPDGGDVTLELSQVDFDCDDLGDNTVTLTVTDDEEDTATCEATVTVIDTKPPFIDYPWPATYGNDSWECGATLDDFGVLEIRDNCGIASIVYSPELGTYFPVGTTNVSVTVTDTSGNVAGVGWPVIVEDRQPPSTWYPIPTEPNDPGECGAVVNYDDPEIYGIDAVHAVDNCGVASVVGVPGPGFFPVGVTHVVVTSTDIHGNINVAGFNVTVNDVEVPVLNGLSASPDVLWPPNHELIPITLTPDATDNCPVTVQVKDVESSEEPHWVGAGNTDLPDWVFVEDGPDVAVRAERTGWNRISPHEREGRIYTITATVTDAAGNESVDSAQATVTVPHNQ